MNVTFAMKKYDAPNNKVVKETPEKEVKDPRMVELELERLKKARARLDREFQQLVKTRAEKGNLVEVLEAVVLQKKLNLEHKRELLVQARINLAALEREVERDEEGVEVAVESLVHGRECLERVQQEMETNKTIVAETRARHAALVPPKTVPKFPKFPKPVPTLKKEVVMPAADIRKQIKGAETSTPNPTPPPIWTGGEGYRRAGVQSGGEGPRNPSGGGARTRDQWDTEPGPGQSGDYPPQGEGDHPYVPDYVPGA